MQESALKLVKVDLEKMPCHTRESACISFVPDFFSPTLLV